MHTYLLIALYLPDRLQLTSKIVFVFLPHEMSVFDAQQRHSSSTLGDRNQFDNADTKSESYNTAHQQRVPFSYSNHIPYSEQELADSLGWVDYTISRNTPSCSVSSHPMHLTSEMNMQQSSFPHRNPSTSTQQLQQELSHSAGVSYGSVPIPQASGSPIGWHSSLESPSFLTDSEHLRTRLSLAQAPVTDTHRRDGAAVADKKAMRRYSHNAGEF